MHNPVVIPRRNYKIAQGTKIPHKNHTSCKQIRNRTQGGRKDPSVYNRKSFKKWYSCINIFHINHHLKCILNARNKIAVFTDTNNSATFMNLGQNEHIFTNILNLKKEMKRLTSLINQ